MQTAIDKAIDLVLEYTVAPIALQAKYAFCYASYIKDMNDAVEDLERNKQIIDDYVAEDRYNAKKITEKTKVWLQHVQQALEEVKTLHTYEESKAKMGCCSGQILINPIARNKLGRKAAQKIVTVKDFVQKKPPREEISSKPRPVGIVEDGVSAEEAAQQMDIVLSSSWNTAMEKVMTALRDNCINVIGLHGMGGVGKSTMINEVYVQVFKQFMFDEVAKVEVKSEVDITRIQEEIASALGLTFTKSSAAVRAVELSKRLLQKPNDQKKKKTVLIILDDLVEKLDIQAVGIPSSNDEVQIKLLLTSRDEFLLSNKMGAHESIHLDVLSNSDAFRMFKTVMQLENVGEGAKKYEQARLIATKCGGLPVVILAIANALKNKALKQWEDTLQKLDVTDALSKLEVSYEHLPSQESKHLFLLCGIIRGPRIQVRDLLKYTFGLGLYERKDIHTLAAAAKELKNLLSGLEAASMLLKSDDIRYVNIHDHMRDLALRIVDRDHRELAHFTLRDYRCKLPRRFDASKLELLFSYCEDDTLQVQDSFFKDMKKLYVLQFINFCGAVSLPLLDLGNLETLCLHECRLSDISMIGELKGLQILSFQGSDICMLPMQLRGLTALKLLDLSDCKELKCIEPNVLGSLTKLEELNMENSFKDWEIDQEDNAPPSNARLIELRNMSRLSNVRIHIPSTSMLPKDGKLFSSKLTMYQIMFGVAQEKAHESAEDSGFYCKFSGEYINFSRVLMLTFDSPDILWQDWVQTTLQTAEVLYLSGRLDGKCESIGEICIKGFECLQHLRMRNCPSFRFIISSNDDSSTNLESLFLENLESLEKLCGGLPRHEEVFSKLKVTNVDYCSKLTHLFDFSLLKGRLSSQLEEITVKKCAEIQCIVVGEGDNNSDVVTLSKLQKLELRDLSKFSSFCTGPSSNVLFSGNKVAFSCLESLIIGGLDKLEDIWHSTNPPAELGNLQSLQVEGCIKLVRVINSSVLMRLQRDLKSLTIGYCGSMKEVFDVDATISSCTDQHLVLFSQLKELRLQMMYNLEGIHNNKNLTMTIFPNIESLIVSKCRHLRYVLSCSSPTAGGYENLKQMIIRLCDGMEAIVEVMLRMEDKTSSNAEMVLFRRLKDLYLQQNKNLKGIYIMGNLSGRDDSVVTMFQDIETVEVLDCPGLRYVLSLSSLPPRVGGFVYLRKIKIWDCESMEAVVMLGTVDQETQPTDVTVTGSDAQNYDVMSYSYPSLKEMLIHRCRQLRTFCQYLCSEQASPADDLPFFSQKEIFPCMEFLYFDGLSKLGEIWPHDQVPPQSSFTMLKQVVIHRCPELPVVFPSTLISRLEKLTDISVGYCDQMIQIIRGDHTGEITFSHLKVLKLFDLPRLEKFSSVNNIVLNFPSLEDLGIQSCGNMTTFSDGIATASTQMFGDLNSFVQKIYTAIAWNILGGMKLQIATRDDEVRDAFNKSSGEGETPVFYTIS